MNKIKQFRKLGGVESFFYWRSKDHHCANFRVGAQYSKEIKVESIYKALSHMCYKYNALATNVFNDGILDRTGAGTLQLMDKFKLKDVLTVVDDPKENCETQIDRVHNYYFPYGGSEPLWKIVLINKKQVLFYCDHVPFDGTAATNFHKILMETLNNIEKTETKNEFIGMESIVYDSSKVIGDNHLPPSPSEILDSTVPVSRHAYELALHNLPLSLSKWVRHWFSDNKYAHLMDYIPRKVPPPGVDDRPAWLHLSPEKVKKLLKLCRDNNTKITALLSVISMLSAKDFIAGHDNRLCWPVNLRDRIDTEKASNLCSNYTPEFGLYIGFVFAELPAVEKIFPNGKINWEVVKYVHDTIHNNAIRSYDTMGLFDTYNSRVYLEGMYGAIEKGDSNPLVYFLSNIGNVKAEAKEGEIEIERVWFDQEADGTIIWMNVCSAKQGMTISMRTHLPEWREMLRSGMEKHLNALIA